MNREKFDALCAALAKAEYHVAESRSRADHAASVAAQAKEAAHAAEAALKLVFQALEALR